MWLLFKIQQHFAHREIWTEIFRFINRTQPRHWASHKQALVELTESWQELFDKSIRVKRMARRALEVTGRDEGVHPGRGYEEQPPADTLIPPIISAREEPRGMPEKKGTRGPSLPKRKGSSPGTFPNEKSQAEACQCKGFIRLVACVGSGDPVRVLRLYTRNTLDEVCSIYC